MIEIKVNIWFGYTKHNSFEKPMWLAEIMCGEKMGGVVSSGLNELLEIVKLSCYKEYEHDTRAIL